MSALDMGFLVDGQGGWNSTNFHVYGNPRDHGDTAFGPGFMGADLGGHVGFAEGVVPWVESHDMYGNDGISRHLTNEQIIVGWALIAARQGTSPLFFVRPGEGFVNSGTMFLRQEDGSFLNTWGHQLLYRDPAVAAINWFANDFIEYPEATSTHGTIAIVQRGSPGNKTGAVLANVGITSIDTLFPVQLADGAYTCQVTGVVFAVHSGWLTGPAIGARSVIVLRDPTNIVPAELDDAHIGMYVYTEPRHRPGIFTDPAGQTVTLTVNGTHSQQVRVYRNDTLITEAPFNHGDTITFGAGADIGDVFLVRLTGYDAGGAQRISTHSQFTRQQDQGPYRIRVEYVRNENPWPVAGIWAWNARGDVFTGGWPGPQMEWAPRLDGQGYAWVFYLPEDTALPVTLIFNNFGGGQQTTPYLTITHSTRVFQIGDGVDIGDPESI